MSQKTPTQTFVQIFDGYWPKWYAVLWIRSSLLY